MNKQVYFPEDLYAALEDALLEYGETRLGCRAISPIWMSYYIDGMSQDLHCDNPHGACHMSRIYTAIL